MSENTHGKGVRIHRRKLAGFYPFFSIFWIKKKCARCSAHFATFDLINAFHINAKLLQQCYFPHLLSCMAHRREFLNASIFLNKKNSASLLINSSVCAMLHYFMMGNAYSWLPPPWNWLMSQNISRFPPFTSPSNF